MPPYLSGAEPLQAFAGIRPIALGTSLLGQEPSVRELSPDLLCVYEIVAEPHGSVCDAGRIPNS